jgi:hypothetical protein
MGTTLGGDGTDWVDVGVLLQETVVVQINNVTGMA